MRIKTRMSQLNSWIGCEGLGMTYKDELELEAPRGKAAHTGSAIGKAIELFHLAQLDGKDVTLGSLMTRTKIESEDRPDPWEKADWNKVEATLSAYINDERNAITVIPEVKVNLVLERPAGTVEISGTFDQVRVHGNVATIWDLKNGVKKGEEMKADYWPQLFGYAYAFMLGQYTLDTKLPRELRRTLAVCQPMLGGIIRLLEYTKPLPRAGQKVFYHMNHDMKTIERMLERIADRMLEVRQGHSAPILRPSYHCWWCPHKNISVCSKLV